MKKKIMYMYLGYPRKVLRGNFFWMIECLIETSSVKEKRIWSDFISRVFNFDYKNVDQSSAIIETCKEENILHEEFATLLEPVQLDSPEAEEMKKDFFEWQDIQNEEQKETSLGPSPSEEIASLLDAFDSGDLSAWWKLNRFLTIKNNSQYYGDEQEPDLTKLPGWENADDTTRTRIIKAAREYIMEQPSEPDKWLGTNNLYFPELAAYRALLLQYHQSPDFLDSLHVDVWKKWAPIILGYPTFGDDEAQQEMVKQAYQHAPEKITETLLLLIDKENQNKGDIFVIRKMLKCWDESLVDLLEQKIKDRNLKFEAVGSLLKDLLKHRSFGAKRHAENILSRPIPLEGDDRKRAAIAAEMLIMYTHDAGWESVWPIFQKNTDFGKEVILAVTHNFDRRNISIEDHFSENQLTDLYIWMEKQFPFTERSHNRAERANINDITLLKSSLLNSLKERGTHKACEGIRKIMNTFPGLEWLNRYLYDAQNITRKQTWIPYSIKDILEITRDRNKRFVQNEQQLLEALIESLKRLEERLHGEIPASRDLWDRHGDGKEKKWRPIPENDFSNYVKRHFDEDIIRKGIIVNREVRIHKGERTDLHVNAITADDEEDIFKKLTVIIEVKGCSAHSQPPENLSETLPGETEPFLTHPFIFSTSPHQRYTSY
jgi:hypothetical protein